MQRFFLAFAAILLTAFSTSPQISHAQSGVPQARFERLLRGVNITRWFWYPEVDSVSDEHYRSYISDAQLAEIRARGFLHVRLPIEPTDLLNENDPATIDPVLLAHLDRAVERILAHNLAVIIDPHNWQEEWYDRLRAEPALADAFVTMWGALAAHFNRTIPDYVFFEVLNEPIQDEAFWQRLQARAVQAIRAAAPEHTIIVGGAQWNSLDTLLNLTPLEDDNIVYNFHFYEPYIFTHQGTIWAGSTGYLRGIPFPATHWNGCDYLPEFGHDLDGWVQDYCYGDPWDEARIQDRIRLAAEWGSRHNVRLTVNEFGVMPTAPYEARLTWLKATREALESHGIGWTIWGYDDAFGLNAQYFGRMDEGVLMMLGL